MKPRRFIKIMMSLGICRNDANWMLRELKRYRREEEAGLKPKPVRIIMSLKEEQIICN